MSNQKKKLVKTICLCAGIALIILLILNVSINGDPYSAGGCVCISFDKWDMLRADRLVIQFRGETYTVTDPDFVRSFAGDTLSGTYSDFCCANLNDGWVEIYRGDRLIRHMRFIENHGAFAYEADALHWVLFGDEGHAFLSHETDKQLRQLIGMKSGYPGWDICFSGPANAVKSEPIPAASSSAKVIVFVPSL